MFVSLFKYPWNKKKSRWNFFFVKLIFCWKIPAKVHILFFQRSNYDFASKNLTISMKKTPPKIQKALTGYLDLKNIDIEKRKIFFCVCFTSFKTFIQIRQSLKLAKENNNRFKREKGQKLPGP